MQVLIATDGTQTAISAAKKALALLRPDTEILLVTVIRGYEDPMEDAGGFEGPLMTPEEAESEFKAHLAAGRNALKHSLEALDKKQMSASFPPQTIQARALLMPPMNFTRTSSCWEETAKVSFHGYCMALSVITWLTMPAVRS
jgi:hypothetical protein